MNYLKERVAYLKGLAEGMQISDTTNEGKLLKAIIDVLDDIALAVDDIEEVQEQMSEQIDSIDEDLAEIESIVFDEEGEECDCCCDDEEDDEDEEEESLEGEFDCPHCGLSISLEDAAFNEDNTALSCPHCNKDIEIEWECDCEDCCDHD
jgi:hypothetical protein